MRTVFDLCERNKNTYKQTSPLPDMDGMLRRAGKPFCSTLDLKSAYEQIRIVPEHVEHSAVTTPDGNMVSLVVQPGDCNAPATYPALMTAYLVILYCYRQTSRGCKLAVVDRAVCFNWSGAFQQYQYTYIIHQSTLGFFALRIH